MNTMTASPSVRRQAGTTLIEVLVTVLLLAFGLLGIAAFQAKAQVGTIESYQRAQAVVLLEDLQSRISGNPAGSADYVTGTGTPLGTGTTAADCNSQTAGAARDKCEWSAMLRGASESQGTTNVGAMIGARGCIEQIQARNPARGVCQPGIYRATVAWQGMHKTTAPTLACGQNAYGGADNDTMRRAVSVRIAIGTPDC
jgi:type IV pilus assembly protein PilV